MSQAGQAREIELSSPRYFFWTFLAMAALVAFFHFFPAPPPSRDRWGRIEETERR